MNIHDIAKALVEDGKGIFICDEGVTSGSHLFAGENIPEDEEHFKTYRELLLTTEGIEEYLSGVSLPPEAHKEVTEEGTILAEVLAEKKILVGVAVRDADDVSALLNEYRSLGVVFATWSIVRTAETIDAKSLSDVIRTSIERVQLCHSVGIVPVLGIDVQSNGAHTAAEAEDALHETAAMLSDALLSAHVDAKGVVAAVSMAVSGRLSGVSAPGGEVADRTVRALSSGLTEDVAGVVFLSDSQTPEEATANLNELARLEPLPWPIAFSFSDAFEAPVVRAWKGNPENSADAQAAFLERLTLAHAADAGGYSKHMENSSLDIQ